MFNNPAQSLQYIKTGKLRALATTGAKRMPQLPELPTVSELGYPGYDVGTWFGLWAPAGTPAPVVGKINAAVKQIRRFCLQYMFRSQAHAHFHHASIIGRFLPWRGTGGRIEARSVAIQVLVSAGSMVSSMKNVVERWIALPAS